jgi:hypothetical protein
MVWTGQRARPQRAARRAAQRGKQEEESLHVQAQLQVLWKMAAKKRERLYANLKAQCQRRAAMEQRLFGS